MIFQRNVKFRWQTAVRWLPAILWMVIIFMLSGQQKSELPSFGFWDLLVKKGAHFIAYACLAIFAQWGVRDWRKALVIAIVYAASDEWHQSFVPTRMGTFADVLIDSLGAAVGLTVYLRGFENWFEKRVAGWL